jgi:predicted glycoside hydrolase/deacetylase ChbG (UPF0249 family)
MMRQLIVNADDFGLSRGVNRGIIEAAERGVVTSASLMVRQPAAGEAGEYARGDGRVSIGIHLDLGEWKLKEGQWVPLYSVVAIDDAAALEAEVSRQLSDFERLVGRKPTHIDSHQHVHREEPVRSIACQAAQKLGVPLRDVSPIVQYCGDFYGQDAEGKFLPEALTVENFIEVVRSLPEGTTELGCHPGYDDGLVTAYRRERMLEIKVLCDPELRDALCQMEVRLCSFADLG